MALILNSYPSYIVPIYDVKMTEDYYLIVMQLCNGGDLSKLKNYLQGWSDMATLNFWKNVCLKIYEGILILHENNVLHRDFKPDNIFVHYPSKNNKTINVENFDPFIDFEIKIGDFGLAWQGLIANMPLTWEVGASLMRSPEYMKGSKNVAK